MRWYLRHWYDLGLLLAIIALGAGVLINLNRLQQILLLSFAVLLLHEFEEYGWPGGIPTFMNEVMRPGADPVRYPLNQLNSMAVNVIAAYPFYLLPVFFPRVIWLGIAPILFGFFEVLIHAGAGLIKAKAYYNPGLLTVIPWLVLSIWYIAEINHQGLGTASDWWIGIAYLVAWVAIFLLGMTYIVLADRDSTHPFDAVEMSKFEKYRHLVHSAVHPHPAV